MDKFFCDKCEKEMKDDEEVFEVGYQYVCQSCLDYLNSQYELLNDLERGK
jgi:hypothetical protein